MSDQESRILGFDPFKLWTDSLTHATRAQRQMRDGLSILEHGLSSLQEMSLFWQKMWGMQGLMPTFGLVPLQEHLSLVRKYEEAKERAAAHEETIKHLRLLLKSQGCEQQEEPATGFQNLMKSQVDAFFTLMRGMQFLPYK